MHKIYTDTEIENSSFIYLSISIFLALFSIAIFYYSAYLFSKDSLSSGLIALLSALFVLAICTSPYEEYKKFSNKSNLKRVDVVIKKIEPYADLRVFFKKAYERGYLLEYEEKLLLKEVSIKKRQQKEMRLTQDIHYTLNHW